MKSRASLVLMEQLIMVLVFALAASMCLGVFLRADQISLETARRDEAAVLAQNWAEVLKSTGGDLHAAAELLGGRAEEERLTLESDGFVLEIQLIDSGVIGLGTAQIRVYWENSLIFELRTGWQEVAP